MPSTYLVKWGLPLLFVLLGALFALAVVETVLWQTDPHRRLPPNGRKDGVRYTWGQVVKSNKLGFRERELDAQKSPDAWRLMVLGDSLTWGGWACQRGALFQSD